jgi:hypothetical protein
MNSKLGSFCDEGLGDAFPLGGGGGGERERERKELEFRYLPCS